MSKVTSSSLDQECLPHPQSHFLQERLPALSIRRTDSLPLCFPYFLRCIGGLGSKETACNMRDVGSIPGLGRSLGGGHGNPL